MPKFPVTPRGIVLYPRLAQPDTQFVKEGVYSVRLVLSPEDAADLKAKIDAAMDESYQTEVSNIKSKEKDILKQKRLIAKIKKADPPYSETEDGNYSFNFKMRASGKTKAGEEFTQRPVLFDRHGTAIAPAAVARMGSGSEVKVAYEIAPFYTQLVGAGVTLRLKAVQVLTLKEYTGGNADAYGFGEEEGDDLDQPTGSTVTYTGDDEDEDEDDLGDSEASESDEDGEF